MNRGKVVAVGTGRVTDQGATIPCAVKKDDVVVIPEYGGTALKFDDGKEYVLFRSEDILGVVA